MDNIQRLAEFLEQVRALLKQPITILSGYRCSELNKLVGSSPSSKHIQGLAADIICPSYGSPLKVCQAIYNAELLYDQLIHEFGGWCHIGLSESSPRRQELTICAGNVTRIGLWTCKE